MSGINTFNSPNFQAFEHMSKTSLKLKPCAVTLGTPFDSSKSRMCPVYKNMKVILEARGWEQKAFHASKLPQGDMCYFTFDGIEKVQENGGKVGILYSLNANIEGLNKSSGSTCIVNMSIDSYEPKNKLVSINHSSEEEILNILADEIRIASYQ